MIPRLFGKTKMHSVGLIEVHFWLATIGVVLYIASMWIAGVMQGIMWRSMNVDGTLMYTFVEGVKASFPYYIIRMTGGLMYVTGMIIMAYNVAKTVIGAQAVNDTIPVLKAHA